MASATSWAGNDLLQLFQSIVIELAHIFQILFLLDFQQLGLQLLHDLGIALRIGLGFFLNGRASSGEQAADAREAVDRSRAQASRNEIFFIHTSMRWTAGLSVDSHMGRVT